MSAPDLQISDAVTSFVLPATCIAFGRANWPSSTSPPSAGRERMPCRHLLHRRRRAARLQHPHREHRSASFFLCLTARRVGVRRLLCFRAAMRWSAGAPSIAGRAARACVRDLRVLRSRLWPLKRARAPLEPSVVAPNEYCQSVPAAVTFRRCQAAASVSVGASPAKMGSWMFCLGARPVL